MPPKGEVPSLRTGRGVLELGGMCRPGVSRPYRRARKNLQSASALAMGEEVWAPTLAEQAHS